MIWIYNKSVVKQAKKTKCIDLWVNNGTYVLKIFISNRKYMARRLTYEELLDQRDKYKRELNEMNNKFKQIGRNRNWKLREDYKLMTIFDYVVKICNEYKVTREDEKRVEGKRWGILNIERWGILRPKDVTWQWILHQVTRRYKKALKLNGVKKAKIW